MYETYYQFKEKPFSLTPDPKYFYLSEQHQGALDHMLFGIKRREGFMVVVGDVGTGKTTLCRCLLDRLDRKLEVALILNPMLSEMDFLRTCLYDLRVNLVSFLYETPVAAGMSTLDSEEETPDTVHRADGLELEWIKSASRKELLDVFNLFLLSQHEAGGSTVLIIDEAQNLSSEVMELLRILSNLETEKEKLLQIIFVGQLELKEKLQSLELKPLNQRISIRYEINPLLRGEAGNYIGHRILVAEPASKIKFSPSALNEIFKYSHGYPRLINLVCDRALLAGYNDQAETIGRAHVKRGVQSLLGEEAKKNYHGRLSELHFPLRASILFFIAGLIMFFLSPAGVNWRDALSVPQIGNPQKMTEGKKNKFQRSPVEPKREATRTISEGALSAKLKRKENTKDVNYRIQVYSLKNKSDAKERVRQLEEEGFESFWRQASSSGQNWYMVYAGPFNNLKQARIHLGALKHSGRKPLLFSLSQAE